MVTSPFNPKAEKKETCLNIKRNAHIFEAICHAKAFNFHSDNPHFMNSYSCVMRFMSIKKIFNMLLITKGIDTEKV